MGGGNLVKLVFQDAIIYLYCRWARIFWRLFSIRKVHLWVKKRTKSLVRRYQAKFANTFPEHLKDCHIWLIKFFEKSCLVIYYIHIIQLSVFSSEYLPIAGKKVKNHY